MTLDLKGVFFHAFVALLACLGLLDTTFAQTVASQKQEFTEQDRLRGSITPEREWWDLLHYHLDIEVMPETRSIHGSNTVTFRVLESHDLMQIDLQEPLKITRATHGNDELKFERNANVYLISFPKPLEKGSETRIRIEYEGQPVESRNPPWSGGFSWQEDKNGNPFIATSCQGIGASIWWPTKDHGYDEPDRGTNISVTVPEALTAVSNGRLKSTSHNEDEKTRTFHWVVTNPINNYSINVNIGKYVNFSETFDGEGGKLDVDYWVLDYQKEKASTHFKETPRTLAAFEHWFGQYPFYEDSFKLVAVPYLGMEHQSSVTYGNGFQNGYRGRDLSDTGVGLKFDFIIVHESGHEWFGNNISMNDSADMWIHEGFTNYSENLFVEYHFTEKEAQDYVIGCRNLIQNDRPIIGTYHRNHEGSGDMYYKGGNMLHTMRHIINDTEKWRAILRGLNKEFWHQTVDTHEVEAYISKESGIDFSLFFDQYLRTAMIPQLHYAVDESNQNKVLVWFDNVVEGFAFPVLLRINGDEHRIVISQKKSEIECGSPIQKFELDRNFYMELVED